MVETNLVSVGNKPPIVVMRERFESRKTELRNALPSDVSPDAFIRAFMTSAQLNPELQACTWSSLWDAALRSCRDGLLPDGHEAAVVPFKSRAQYIRMYSGVLRQFRRSGQFKWMTTGIVREGEKFEHWVELPREHFLHVPGPNIDAPIIYAYALATTKDGGEFCKVLPRAEIDKHRSQSRAQRDDAPWKVWYEAMAQKTAILQLAKLLPNARDLIGQEDGPEQIIEADAPPVQIASRKPGAAAALDQFSGASPDTVGLPSDTAGDAEQGPVDQSAAADDVDRASAADLDEAHRATIQAYEAGKAAKAAGHNRKALPDEYRDSKRTREALAWTAGHDGQSMPEFDASSKVLVP